MIMPSFTIDKKIYYLWTLDQQQLHSFHEQFGHSFGDLLFLHSSGGQPQSAHII